VPISISALAANRRTVNIDFSGETLRVTYKPSAINASQEERELADKETGHHVLSIIRTLTETIVSWDLLGEDGQPLPLTEDALKPLGIDILSQISRAIVRDALPNRTTQPSSNGTSQQTASSAPSPSGT
jgi:hypothetical protein